RGRSRPGRRPGRRSPGLHRLRGVAGWRATAERPVAGLAGSSRERRRTVVPRLAAAGPVPLAMGIGLALHRGAGRTAVPVRSAVTSAAVGVAALSAAIVFAASLSHLLASPA